MLLLDRVGLACGVGRPIGAAGDSRAQHNPQAHRRELLLWWNIGELRARVCRSSQDSPWGLLLHLRVHLGLGGDCGVIKEVLLCVEVGEVGAPVEDLSLHGLGAWRRGNSALTVCLLLSDELRGRRRRHGNEVALILVLDQVELGPHVQTVPSCVCESHRVFVLGGRPGPLLHIL